MNRTLPTDSAARKGFPIFSGCIAYFSAALAGVARWSKLNNDKHNPGEPLHHARGKSMDHRDCIPRHLMDLADIEAAMERSGAPETRAADVAALLDEVDAMAWRSLALSQELHEKYDGAPLAPGARLPIVDEATASPPRCAGENCNSTNPRLHSAECFAEHDRATTKRPWRLVRRAKSKAKRRK